MGKPWENGGLPYEKFLNALFLPIPWRIHGAAIYGVPWISWIYPLYVSIYTSTMDPMGMVNSYMAVEHHYFFNM